jgi:Flavodoxins
MSNKTLIAYYSRSGENYMNGSVTWLPVGNTKLAAEILKEILGADIFQIRPVREYSENYYKCIDEAKQDLYRNRRPEIVKGPKRPEDYSTIYLGYPNYWGTIPMPVATFLETYDLAGKVIKPFCTHEGSGMGRSEADIRKLCPDSIVMPGLALRGGSAPREISAIQDWVEEAISEFAGQKAAAI